MSKDLDVLLKVISVAKPMGLFPDEEAALLRIYARHEAAVSTCAEHSVDMLTGKAKGSTTKAFVRLHKLFNPEGEGNG